MPDEQPLTGCRVLIVEDEWFLADDLRVALKSLGANQIPAQFADVIRWEKPIDPQVVLRDLVQLWDRRRGQ
jgi:hypothetical protein